MFQINISVPRVYIFMSFVNNHIIRTETSTPSKDYKQPKYELIFLQDTKRKQKNCIYTHWIVIKMLIPDKTTIGKRQYPRTETTDPNVTWADVAIKESRQ